MTRVVLLARVAVPVPLGRAFSYTVPSHFESPPLPGARVVVEFGRRKILGIVLDVVEREPEIDRGKLKPIVELVEEEPVLPLELLDFLRELARYYQAPIGEVMRLALPRVERSSAGRLQSDVEVKGSVGRMVQVASALPEARPENFKGQAAEVLRHLLSVESERVSELAKSWKNARSALKKLVTAGAVEIQRQQSFSQDPFADGVVLPESPPTLTAAQRDALKAITVANGESEAKAFLLQGVTGSGKTEVYLRAVQAVRKEKKSAIILVPEIALTPQLVARFRARISEPVAVLHSALSDLERHSMWRKLRAGEIQVLVGARSALFAPVAQLGLICVDEEHDPSFKQEEGVRYNARDMALLRAYRAGALCVLGTATPSAEATELARKHRLRHLRLPQRARKGAELPQIELIDRRRFGPGPSQNPLLSLPLHRALEETLADKGQAILFLNRRGFSPSLLCQSCGEIIACPDCSVSLTLHKSRRERLCCHYCDYVTNRPERCSKCHGRELGDLGSGTERIEMVLCEAFPGARVERLDRDVGGGRKSEAILDRMRKREIDILVGTQMVAKGHDLPQVTLVGVLNADGALSLPDFRAAERTFQLIVQVAGRAGRGARRGRVLIQTYKPEHPAVALAARHDVDGFVERELSERAELGYPPYSRLALIRVSAKRENKAESEARRLARLVQQQTLPGVSLLGPAPAPLARLRGRYRYRFLLRAENRQALRPALQLLARSVSPHDVRVSIDVDPYSML